MRKRRPAPKLTTRQADRLRKVAKDMGNQSALARRMGVAQQTVSKLVKQEIGVTVELALALDAAIGGEHFSKETLRPDVFFRAGEVAA